MQRSWRAFTQDKSGPFTPHQVDFTFGHVVTDATHLACVYSGQIGAFTPHQADFTFGHDDK
jgi:hypothetical protein